MDNISEEHEALLLKEAALTSTSIGYGLTILRKATLNNKGEYYQSFFQLSIGLERLMKLIIIEKYRGEHGKFPTNQTLKNYGHELTQLYHEVSSYYTGEYNNPIHNHICRSIIELLTTYAKSTRYYNLDTLTFQRSNHVDPLVQWKNIQNMIRKTHKKRKNRLDTVGETLSQIMDEVSITSIFDERNNKIKSYSQLYADTYDIDFVQGYAVFYTLKIINYLADLLITIEKAHNLYPILSEFFYYYHDEWLSPSEIRRKKNWIYP